MKHILPRCDFQKADYSCTDKLKNINGTSKICDFQIISTDRKKTLDERELCFKL